MRKMASIRVIREIKPIENADAIEVAVVDGWEIVVKKGEYKPGDFAVYCEIDSWIPNSIAPFLSRGEPREYNGVKGERLRTVKLRGQLSQGLLLPINVIPPFEGDIDFEPIDGFDLTEILDIQKWEMPVPAQLAGQIKGNFPSQIPKTDQERIQNIFSKKPWNDNEVFEVTEKLEGSSMTCYLIDGVFGVCSRNLDLKRDENNAFWATAIRLYIEERMRRCASLVGVDSIDFAIQGALIGPGVQGNIYNLRELDFRAFDVFDISSGKYMLPDDRNELLYRLGITPVQILYKMEIGNKSLDALLQIADCESELAPTLQEGIVFKSCSRDLSFKIVSNKYLLKQK